MQKSFPNLSLPVQIGSLRLPNRVLMAPMATSFASADGDVTEWMIDYYAERGRGGAGLIIVENANVDYPLGISGTTQLRVDKDRYIPGLWRLAQSIRLEGALCALQLNHAGAVSRKAVEEGVQPVGPSEGPNWLYSHKPRALKVAEIERISKLFGSAAKRAQKAGFDAVEIHGAHAYLIAQFLSPLSNQREDVYGGNLENRARFACEIVKEVKRVAGPEFPVLFRLNACEFIENGLTVAESIAIAERLESAGVDALDLSVGTHYQLNRSLCSMLEPMSYQQGWRLEYVGKFKNHVNVPIIGVGPFREPEVAENAVEAGKVDVVAVGRPFIADSHWAAKAFNGREGEIRRCISCNEGCVQSRVFEDRPISCTVNPEVGWEGTKQGHLTSHSRLIMVVGGGPAGCAAAIGARQKGHGVILLEQSSNLGGNCLLASRLPYREKLTWVVDYQRKKLADTGVEVRFGTSFSWALVNEIRPDALVLAIGAEPSIPQEIEMRNMKPIYAEDILKQGILWSNAHVAVVGGGALGCEIALALARADNDVFVLEALEAAAREVEPINRFDLLEKVAEEPRVRLSTNTKVLVVDGTSVHYEAKSEGKGTLDVDYIVWATGYRPRDLNNWPPEPSRVSEIKRIGDCHKPRNILHAVREGYWFGVRN